MKTIAEINAIAPYNSCEWQEGYGIWQAGFMEGQKSGADEQKAIDDELLKRVHKGVIDKAIKEKKELIDKACEWLINTYLGDYVTDEYGNGGIGDNVKLAEDFRKAMEE